MATLEAFLQQSATFVKQTLPGLPAYSKVSRKQIEQQLTQCLEVYRGLAIRLENYASDGSTVEPRNMALLALEGTIPMSYRERQYNIPVSIRLPQGFPVSAPQCYVLQTNGLVLKPQHTVVCPTGLCNFSRFEKGRWDPKHSSVKDLVDLMVRVFSMEPPLYSPQSAAQQALAAKPTPALSFSALVTPIIAAAHKPAKKGSWEAKAPTSDELDFPLDALNTLLAKLDAHDADNEDATDEAFRNLQDEKIKVDEFLKTIRRLAREQFMNHALANKAAHLKPFLEERDAKAAAEQAKVAAQEAERLADEQAERDRVEQEAERQRWEEQERRRQEEERKRGEDERRRVEEERRRQEEEQRRLEQEWRERQAVEEKRRIEELAQREREERERAELEWRQREEQQRVEAEQEARRREEDDRRLAEKREREERDRLQRLELQQMESATPVGGQGGWQNGWPPGGGQFNSFFRPPPEGLHSDHFQPPFMVSPNPGYPHSQAQFPGPPPFVSSNPESASASPYGPPPDHNVFNFPAPGSSAQSLEPASNPEPVPAFPYGGPPNHNVFNAPPLITPPPVSAPHYQPPYPPQYPPQPPPGPGPPFYAGPYGQQLGPNQGPVPFGAPSFPYGQPPGPFVQPQAGEMYGPPGMWPPSPPQGY